MVTLLPKICDILYEHFTDLFSEVNNYTGLYTLTRDTTRTQFVTLTQYVKYHVTLTHHVTLTQQVTYPYSIVTAITNSLSNQQYYYYTRYVCAHLNNYKYNYIYIHYI